MNSSFLDRLQCPLHNTALRHVDRQLMCETGHRIAVEQGVPVFAERPRRESRALNMPPLPCPRVAGSVDPFVDDWIVNTNGNLYWNVRGHLPRYPIPRWPVPGINANGARPFLVEIGCSWGRWTVSAARAGFSACGTDIHIDALWAATRVSRELGAPAHFVCCDAARLPFKPETVDLVFSYSVLQHLEKETALQVLRGIAQILRPGGICLVQLPNAFGLVSLLRQARRGFRKPRKDTYEMRYWTHREIAQAFRDTGLGNLQIRAEGFLLQNTQPGDLDLLSIRGAAAVLLSCALRAVANAMPPLPRAADSLWVQARKG